jgi:hypothetical protein
MLKWIKSWFKKPEKSGLEIKCVGALTGHKFVGGSGGGGGCTPFGETVVVNWKDGKPTTIQFRAPDGEHHEFTVPADCASMTVERRGGGGGVAISGSSGGPVFARGGRGGTCGQPGEPGEFKTNMTANELYEFLRRNPPK